LTDYRVRILNAGTEAVTRVLIESGDESGERWTTIGVSPNIIDASFQALMDSIVYKLVKSGAPACCRRVLRCGRYLCSLSRLRRRAGEGPLATSLRRGISPSLTLPRKRRGIAGE